MKKKKIKKLPLILGIVFLLAGAAVIAWQIFFPAGAVKTKELTIGDYNKLSVGDTAELYEVFDFDFENRNNMYVTFFHDENDEDMEYFALVILDDDTQTRFDKIGGIYSKKPMKLKAAVAANTDEQNEYLKKILRDYFIMTLEGSGVEWDDESEQILGEAVLPCHFEADELYTGKTNYLFYILGGVLAFAGIILVLCSFIRFKWVFFFLLMPIILIIAILSILFFNRIRSIASIRKTADGLYTISCYGDQHIDEYLGGNFSDVDSVFDWLEKRLAFGLDVSSLVNADFACSSFLAETPEGNHLFGRNFDYDETDQAFVRTKPKNGYESIGMADLNFVGVGNTMSIDPDSPIGRYFMLTAPYMVLDGINEKGVGVSILQLDIDEFHQDKGRPDILIFQAIRGILDKCADVDEAIEFLEQYDIHTMYDVSYHLFICDVSGRSVICEWHDNEMQVLEHDCVENEVMVPCDDYREAAMYEGRYLKMRKFLDERKGILTRENAMTLLKNVQQLRVDFGTEWSCVYDLENFSVDICLDNDYDNVYTISADDLK